MKPLSERVATDVLIKRIAFCDGYARLFKTLCDYAGIRSEVITGYADGGMGHRRMKFISNHRWNAVYLDSAWHLLDVTWASGYMTYSSDDFIQQYNHHYFLTSADEFIRNHYPEDLQWTLLSKPPAINEFKYSPFKTGAFLKSKIISYKPASGIIEAVPGDTVQFELETGSEAQRLAVVDTAYIDSAVVAMAMSPGFAAQKCIVNRDKVLYNYIVPPAGAEWLHIIFNDEVVMRYKLNISRNYTALK